MAGSRASSAATRSCVPVVRNSGFSPHQGIPALFLGKRLHDGQASRRNPPLRRVLICRATEVGRIERPRGERLIQTFPPRDEIPGGELRIGQNPEQVTAGLQGSGSRWT